MPARAWGFNSPLAHHFLGEYPSNLPLGEVQQVRPALRAAACHDGPRAPSDTCTGDRRGPAPASLVAGRRLRPGRAPARYRRFTGDLGRAYRGRARVVVLRVAPNAPAEPGPWEPRQLDARGRVRLTHGEAALLGSDRVLVCRTGSGNEVVVLTGAALASPLTPRLLATVLGSVDA